MCCFYRLKKTALRQYNFFFKDLVVERYTKAFLSLLLLLLNKITKVVFVATSKV